MKQAAVANLLRKVEAGVEEIVIPDVVIADALYVLTSKRLYNLSRDFVADALRTIVGLPGSRVRDKRTMLGALSLFGMARLGFRDLYIVSSMRHHQASTIYS
ncbi:MAG: hypothetical protein ACOC9Y_06020, partial [Chloroflexota bacterium]